MTVDQTNKIDFVHIDPDSDDAYLTISDHLDWKEEDEHIWVLQEKINAYLLFIESGELRERFPQAEGKDVTIRVFGKYPISQKAKEFYEVTKNTVKNAGFNLTFEVSDQ